MNQSLCIWVVTPCSDVVGYQRFGSSKSFVLLPYHYKVSQPRRPRLESTFIKNPLHNLVLRVKWKGRD